MTTPSLQATQVRLATHYLRKLHQASALARHGDRQHAGLNAAMQDWEQIAHWQAWAAAGMKQDDERARLAAAFPVGAEDALRAWQPPTRQLDWVRQALDAARALKDSAAELELLYQTAMLCMAVEALDEGDAYGAELMARAEAAGDNRAVGRAWYVRATSAFTRGDYDTAERAFRQALLCFESSSAPSPELPYVWRGLARVAQFRGDYAEAETRYRRHLALAVEAGSEHDVIDAHIAISGIYLALRDYAGAEAMAAQAVEQSRAYPRSMFLARAQIALAHAQKWQGKLESACESYQQGVVAARATCPPSTVVNALYGLGQAWYMRGDAGAAARIFEEALSVARSIPLPLRVCEVAHDMVFAYLACGNRAAARDSLRLALDYARQLGTPHFLAKVVAAALTLAHEDGDNEQAALWAGTLDNYSRNLHPSLFDASVLSRVETALSPARYAGLFAAGRQRSLDEAFGEVLAHYAGTQN